MRAFATALTALLVLAVAGPAAAQEDGFFTAEIRESIKDWAVSTKNTFLTGTNGMVTSPADIAMETVDPSDEYRELWGGKVISYPIGFGKGVMLFAYRLGTGVMDMVVAPFPFVTLSPEPRYEVVPGFEWEEY